MRAYNGLMYSPISPRTVALHDGCLHGRLRLCLDLCAARSSPLGIDAGLQVRKGTVGANSLCTPDRSTRLSSDTSFLMQPNPEYGRRSLPKVGIQDRTDWNQSSISLNLRTFAVPPRSECVSVFIHTLRSHNRPSSIHSCAPLQRHPYLQILRVSQVI